VILGPLGFVVFLSMIKDMVEDIKRYFQDRFENNNQCEVACEDREFKKKRWKDVRVGDIIKVYENQYFPCDMILINSSGEKGICYIETKNLDGETNLKHKKATKECVDMSQNENEIINNF
jgi:phospholipid-translocating ATPase